MRARWRGLPILVLGAAVSVAATGCDDGEETGVEIEPASAGVAAAGEGAGEAPEPPPGEGGGTAGEGEPQGEAAAEIEDPSFLLRANAQGPYRSGELGRFGISLTPRGEYHVNQEYPMSIELTGPNGVEFPKSTLERADAAEFGEQEARFDVPFTPGATGEHRIEAKVSFAVCTPENCVPDERTLAVLLPVE